MSNVLNDRVCQIEMRIWLEDLCKRLGLRGRVRVALDGLNVTVRGKDSALQEHMRAVAAHPALALGKAPRNSLT
eukprot:2115688-Pyramimonas_sp.AAC.1